MLVDIDVQGMNLKIHLCKQVSLFHPQCPLVHPHTRPLPKTILTHLDIAQTTCQ
jgi:hypothetical protein